MNKTHVRLHGFGWVHGRLRGPSDYSDSRFVHADARGTGDAGQRAKMKVRVKGTCSALNPYANVHVSLAARATSHSIISRLIMFNQPPLYIPLLIRATPESTIHPN